MDTLNPWALLSVGLLAIMLAHFIKSRRSALVPGGDAYRRGLEYALLELYASVDEKATMSRLQQEAANGRDMDPSPFDDAILDVVRDFECRRDIQAGALLRVAERLQGMEQMGEASSSEVGTALDVVTELLGGTPAEPSVFVTEYLHIEGGQARLVRRPLRDWPSWADDLNPVHTHGVPHV